jgi:hypothetical protein
MRLIIIGLLLGTILPGAHAQEKAPFPYKVEYFVIGSGYGADVLQLTVTSIVFDMNISGITLNRGNCQIFENKIINNRFVNVTFPQTLKFGLKRTFWSQANCEPREMIINTIEGGKFTLTFID